MKPPNSLKCIQSTGLITCFDQPVAQGFIFIVLHITGAGKSPTAPGYGTGHGCQGEPCTEARV